MSTQLEAQRFILLVTDGTVIDYPPEVYADLELAHQEAERWALLLRSRNHARIHRPFRGRWQVGDYWVRVVEAVIKERSREVWVGTYWTRDGVPEPEAELFATRDEARTWAVDPVPGRIQIGLTESPWLVAVTFRIADDEEYAVVHRGKNVSWERHLG
jgi:hypothetical protein